LDPRLAKAIKVYRVAKTGLTVYLEKRNIQRHMGRLSSRALNMMDRADMGERILNQDVIREDVYFIGGKAVEQATPHAHRIANRWIEKQQRQRRKKKR
jgi:hypothetical protein